MSPLALLPNVASIPTPLQLPKQSCHPFTRAPSPGSSRHHRLAVSAESTGSAQMDTLERLRQADGAGPAHAEALAEDAIVWASLNGLVIPWWLNTVCCKPVNACTSSLLHTIYECVSIAPESVRKYDLNRPIPNAAGRSWRREQAQSSCPCAYIRLTCSLPEGQLREGQEGHADLQHPHRPGQQRWGLPQEHPESSC